MKKVLQSIRDSYLIEYKSRKANWDNIDKLQGSKDYDDWSHQVSLLLSVLHLDILDGIKLSDENTEILVYQNMVCGALYLLTQVNEQTHYAQDLKNARSP